MALEPQGLRLAEGGGRRKKKQVGGDEGKGEKGTEVGQDISTGHPQ